MLRTKKVLGLATMLMVGAYTTGALAEEKPYDIKDGKVDEKTFTGWQVFRQSGCGSCHGGPTMGGTGVNSLVERLKTISKEQFVASVTNGKNAMPPQKANKKVIDNLDNLYAFIKARSDGALGDEKPVKQ